MNDLTTIAGIRSSIPAISGALEGLADLSFSSRDGYLAWRTAWRECLLLSIQAVRAAKHIRGDKTRDGDDRNAANHYRNVLRGEANALFDIRVSAKIITVAHHKAARISAETPASVAA